MRQFFNPRPVFYLALGISTFDKVSGVFMDHIRQGELLLSTAGQPNLPGAVPVQCTVYSGGVSNGW